MDENTIRGAKEEGGDGREMEEEGGYSSGLREESAEA